MNCFKEFHILLFTFLGNKRVFLLQIKFFYRKSYRTFSIEINSANGTISQLVPYLKYFTFAKERRALKQKNKKKKPRRSQSNSHTTLLKKNCLKYILHSCMYLENHGNKDHFNTEIKSEKMKPIIKCNILHNYLLAITPFMCKSLSKYSRRAA